jgi:LPXTG-motif cell wall-anchored protein
MRNLVSLAALTAVVLLGTAGHVAAGAPTVVPEISPASISAGLAMLAGGALLLRARRRK